MNERFAHRAPNGASHEKGDWSGSSRRSCVFLWYLNRSLPACNALRYAWCMTQLVTRIDNDLAASIDELIAQGVVESRSDAVRQGLRALIDQTRRHRTADAIATGYADHPQTEDEVAWADQATVQMIADEPW